jgi:hypothetical protein
MSITDIVSDDRAEPPSCPKCGHEIATTEELLQCTRPVIVGAEDLNCGWQLSILPPLTEYEQAVVDRLTTDYLTE